MFLSIQIRDSIVTRVKSYSLKDEAIQCCCDRMTSAISEETIKAELLQFGNFRDKTNNVSCAIWELKCPPEQTTA